MLLQIRRMFFFAYEKHVQKKHSANSEKTFFCSDFDEKNFKMILRKKIREKNFMNKFVKAPLLAPDASVLKLKPNGNQ